MLKTIKTFEINRSWLALLIPFSFIDHYAIITGGEREGEGGGGITNSLLHLFFFFLIDHPSELHFHNIMQSISLKLSIKHYTDPSHNTVETGNFEHISNFEDIIKICPIFWPTYLSWKPTKSISCSRTFIMVLPPPKGLFREMAGSKLPPALWQISNATIFCF